MQKLKSVRAHMEKINCNCYLIHLASTGVNKIYGKPVGNIPHAQKRHFSCNVSKNQTVDVRPTTATSSACQPITQQAVQ